MEFYINEKQRKRNRRILKIKIYSGLAVFLLFLGSLFYGVVYSPLFQIKKIDNGDVELIKNLKNYFINHSKIFRFLGENNILVWNNNVVDFLKQQPDIINLSIKKNYFNRTIVIDFQKREKFGIWCVMAQNDTELTQNDAECWWFDKNGVVFERAPKTEGEMIYKVKDFTGRQLAIGKQILEKHLLENLLKIFDVLEQVDLNVRTLQIKDLSLQEVFIERDFSVGSKLKIYFSLRFNPEFSLAVFKNLKKIDLEKVEYIDLRIENRAYYKLK